MHCFYFNSWIFYKSDKIDGLRGRQKCYKMTHNDRVTPIGNAQYERPTQRRPRERADGSPQQQRRSPVPRVYNGPVLLLHRSPRAPHPSPAASDTGTVPHREPVAHMLVDEEEITYDNTDISRQSVMNLRDDFVRHRFNIVFADQFFTSLGDATIQFQQAYVNEVRRSVQAQHVAVLASGIPVSIDGYSEYTRWMKSSVILKAMKVVRDVARIRHEITVAAGGYGLLGGLGLGNIDSIAATTRPTNELCMLRALFESLHTTWNATNEYTLATGITLFP